jgi:hypothetical protein
VPIARAILLLAGVAALAIGAVACVFGAFVSLLWFVPVGLAMIVGALFERGRYKPAAAEQPGPGWAATDESFVDPASGERVTVYYQASTGERRYVKR